MERKYQNVAVLKGGISSEREVSLRSGLAISQGLREAGYTVTEIDVVQNDVVFPSSIDAVFVALHGAFGEDGGVQQVLADMNLPYTGSDVASCRIAFDKVLTRNCLSAAGIPVPAGDIFEAIDPPPAPTRSLPLVVKPPCEGSSMGCHLVFEDADWNAAFLDAARYSKTVLVEEYIPGRELTVGLVGDQVLPVVEIKTATQWYDFEAKYVTGETQYQVPAILTDMQTKQLQTLALETFRALGARGFGRVDFRLSPAGNPYVLEFNSIPGFTPTSLLPKAAQAAGIGFSELCATIMELAHYS